MARDHLGHEHLDTTAHLQALSRLYNRLWLYDNLFQPVQQMSAKEMYGNAQGERQVRRTFDDALPPLDRLLRAQVLPKEKAKGLLRWRDAINLMRLRESIYASIEALFALPLANDARQDVRESLFVPEGDDFLTQTRVPEGDIPRWEQMATHP